MAGTGRRCQTATEVQSQGASEKRIPKIDEIHDRSPLVAPTLQRMQVRSQRCTGDPSVRQIMKTAWLVAPTRPGDPASRSPRINSHVDLDEICRLIMLNVAGTGYAEPASVGTASMPACEAAPRVHRTAVLS